ncbi:hypothetical protein [Pseudomonas sp. MWU16-30323]|uniref:hypothetical protein n=1 Tax=Pseudomonas sp. MWU16-30323 TaxID=2878094 RepID=UPI001CF99FDA|nr:hypothetical protein [Pseudomonas sp. MWU16-30323]
MFNVIRSAPAPASLAKNKSWTAPDVIEALRRDFSDKCYICETKDPLSLNVEHFDAHQGDPLKMFDWNNLFFSCGRCNNLKRHLFNNLINCTNHAIDAFRLIKHHPPLTPFSATVIIEPSDDDPKTIETANLIRKVFNEDNTGNKAVTATYLRKRVFRRYAKLVEQMNIYESEDSLPAEKAHSLEKIRNLMSRNQEYSAFLRWAILDSPELLELVKDSMD